MRIRSRESSFSGPMLEGERHHQQIQDADKVAHSPPAGTAYGEAGQHQMSVNGLQALTPILADSLETEQPALKESFARGSVRVTGLFKQNSQRTPPRTFYRI